MTPEARGRSRYQAQAGWYHDFQGKPCAWYKLYDAAIKRVTLKGSEILPRQEMEYEDFNPVAWFHANGWDIDIPYVDWSVDGQGGRYTNRVRSAL